ncbi:RraA family protein [Youngiibacter multivorans]|uniref:Putative 4-hydroxy-4-methyl-2-oxoglutarate aldolase n=1 Tax=Youngiibacter multivorans TaxID=937251 RepID=A0ABS4FZX9_9CLOT|nr:RraA family protein [Youngiibacter multivorans]MBP1917848.1 RraA family protein [Youngiibacter multivorans]
MAVGLRVFMNPERVDAETIEAFRELPGSNVADCMGRMSGMHSEIRRLSKNGFKMVGSAITVKVRPGDNLMLHKALDMAQEGDVIVVSNGGDRSHSLMGEIMVRHAEFRKLGGIVLDGPIRDIDTIRNLEIPIYATGTTPAGPYKEGPGEINVNITCGGVSLNPGDLVIGDDDGVVVVPREDLEEVLKSSIEFNKKDQSKIVESMAGKLNRSWVDKSLAEKGCEYIDLKAGRKLVSE